MSSEHKHHASQPSQQVEGSHPGAAFGIPAGATGEEVVDAIFNPAGPGGGVDPELLPYLEAADSEDGLSIAEVREAGRTAAEREQEAEDERLAALRELVAHNLVPGGDLARLDELLAEVDADDSDDWNDWEPVLPDPAASASGSASARSADEADDAAVAVADHGRGGAAHTTALLEARRRSVVAQRMREVEAEILSRAPEHQVQPSLERVEAVLDIIGNPERAYRVVHVTGTNGKTSTARMVERLLAATGMRTGRFTSPHLATIRERISLDGEPISEEGFIAAWEDVAPYIAMVDQDSQAKGGPRLSFFEVLTVMALAAFADYPVDVAVIEVGMGGRWDATNVVASEVEVITPVGLDHTRWLGDSLTEIATEKAGIIKDGATLVTARQPEQALGPISQAAQEHAVVWRREADPDSEPQAEPGAPQAGELAVVDRELAVGGQLVTLRTAAGVYEDVFVPLHGEYQARNALLALAAAEALFGGRLLPARIVEEGFASVTSPGRLEVVRSSPTVLVDAAHNPHGVAALREAVEEVFGFTHLVAVLGLMADKDLEGVLAELEPFCEAVVCVPVDSPRAAAAEDLAEVAREVFGADRVQAADSLPAGLERAQELAERHDGPLPSSGVLVLGSVVLAAEARALFGRA
ncbi:bifunctional folylpolyglutamate synthase/dihydrofolate synthase [Actinomyces weissii]|uniref:tetrahydrofolate synthase n=1 Tax=Actinomyces weissii TaxID=675090 RepID=A0A7T7S1P2_9ACTO|nr:folylpolyglutamate synthase/dihydrofolate synthase family protein [Actinomyces weissii]QQM66822.1 bifunctional folylpolyglutamate synthase/dihydrofolate synthase [Actinomyces weissii]